MHNYLELVIHKRLEVKITDLHDDLKSNEVHDAMLNYRTVGSSGVLQGRRAYED